MKKTKKSKRKQIHNYKVNIPVFKQGDDFGGTYNGQNISKAFQSLAERYEDAADVCRRVGKALTTIPDLSSAEANGDTHFISLTVEETNDIDQLVEEGILTKEEYEDE